MESLMISKGSVIPLGKELPLQPSRSSGRRSYLFHFSKADHDPCTQTLSLIIVFLFSGDGIPKTEPYSPAACGATRDNMCDAPYHCWASCYWRSGYTAWHKFEFNFYELSVLAIEPCWHLLLNCDTCELLLVKCGLTLKPLKSRPGKHIFSWATWRIIPAS